MSGPDVHVLSGAYVLDALPEDERRLFQEHLRACAACQQEVAELGAAAARLGEAAAEPAPPGLRSRVLAAIDTTRQDHVGGGGRVAPAPPRPATGWERLRAPLAAAAAAAVIAIAGLSVVVGRLNARVDELQARNQAIATVLAAGDVRTITLTGMEGVDARVIVAADRGAALFVADGLPPVGEDEVYELWRIDPSGAVPAGLFRPRADGQVIELVATDLSGAAAIGVTVEPAGGSLQPTSDPILVGEI